MRRHFTATALVTDSRNRTLLLWHKRLQRWMPPGGHVDENETPEDAAVRECKEETGLDVEIVGETQPDVFLANPKEGRLLQRPMLLLLENIPASPERGEPAHQHMDFVYRAKPLRDDQPLRLLEEEGSDLRWFTPGEIAALDPATEIFANVQRTILSYAAGR